MTHNCTVSQCRSLTVCVAEWSRRPRYGSAVILRLQVVSLSPVIRQWRSRVGRWQPQWVHSTTEQSTTTTTQLRHILCRRYVGPKTIMLQRTHITTLHSTQQWGAVRRRHVAICSTLTNRLMSAWVQLAMYTVVVIATVALATSVDYVHFWYFILYCYINVKQVGPLSPANRAAACISFGFLRVQWQQYTAMCCVRIKGELNPETNVGLNEYLCEIITR